MSSIKKTAQAGFTLIEILVVITIISILAAVAIPTYLDYVARSQVATTIGAFDTYTQKAAEFYQANGAAPATRADLGLSATATDGAGKYHTEITVQAGRIIAGMGNSASGAISNPGANAIAYDMLVNNDGAVQFICSGSTVPANMTNLSDGLDATSIPDQYLPASCLQ